MKITRTADWRTGVPFDAPVVVSDVLPGDPARCTGCGIESDPLPRTQLWALKHRHPNDPAGIVRFYCSAHLPAVERPTADPGYGSSRGSARTSGRAPRATPRATTPRTPKAPEKPDVVCPDCFVVVPASGVCGMCGQPVA